MATFNIQVNKKNSINIGDLNLYYGTVNIIPTSESDILNLNSKLIDSTLIDIEILNNTNRHIIAIPENVLLINVLDVKNSYEEYVENLNQINTIEINTNEGLINYKVYLLETERAFFNNTIFSIFLNFFKSV